MDDEVSRALIEPGQGIDIDLFVIGAMKAATTSLCDWLDTQPDVAMSNPKEPGIFNSESDVQSWLPRIDTLFDRVGPTVVRVEGSTFYTKFPSIPGVPERLRSNCPDARFVYVMRHPVERLLSQYRFDSLRGVNDLTLAQSLEALPQLVDNSRYALQLGQWLDHFDPDRFLLVFAERFIAEPETQIDRVLRFMGLDPGDDVVTPTNLHSNRTDDILKKTRMRRLLRQSSIGKALRPYVPHRLVETYHRRAGRRSKPMLTPGERAGLVETFDADLAVLTDLTSGPGISCESWHQVVASWTPALDSDRDSRPT